MSYYTAVSRFLSHSWAIGIQITSALSQNVPVFRWISKKMLQRVFLLGGGSASAATKLKVSI